ncbi:MAG: hypothetical protein ACM3JG_06375 [Thiohalocapsa sp.]
MPIVDDYAGIADQLRRIRAERGKADREGAPQRPARLPYMTARSVVNVAIVRDLLTRSRPRPLSSRDLTDADIAALGDLRDTIAAGRFPFSPRIRHCERPRPKAAVSLPGRRPSVQAEHKLVLLHKLRTAVMLMCKLWKHFRTLHAGCAVKTCC